MEPGRLTRHGPRSTVVVRLDSRRATGAPTPWWPPTRGKCRILPPPQRSVLHFPRFPGKMQNGMPSEHQAFDISPGFRAKCRILPRRPSSVLHFPRGGDARAGGRLPRKHHPRSFPYGPIRPLRDRGGEAWPDPCRRSTLSFEIQRRDPGDVPIIPEVAAGQADVLVTGNQDLLEVPHEAPSGLSHLVDSGRTVQWGSRPEARRTGCEPEQAGG